MKYYEIFVTSKRFNPAPRKTIMLAKMIDTAQHKIFWRVNRFELTQTGETWHNVHVGRHDFATFRQAREFIQAEHER